MLIRSVVAVCLSVSLSVCPLRSLISESLDIETEYTYGCTHEHYKGNFVFNCIYIGYLPGKIADFSRIFVVNSSKNATRNK